MPASPRFVVLGKTDSSSLPSLLQQLNDQCELIIPTSLPEALTLLKSDETLGAVVLSEETGRETLAFHTEGLLEQFPQGVAVLDASFQAIWSNREFQNLIVAPETEQRDFYALLGMSGHPAANDCPLSSAMGDQTVVCQTLRTRDNVFLEVNARAIEQGNLYGDEPYLLVTVRDVSEREIGRQKFAAIYEAGLALGDLSPQDIAEMAEEERVALLGSKILYYTKDVLQYETIEVRLLDRKTGKLNSLLQVGMHPLAAGRELYAAAEKNGVTGFVAETGKSYLCKDTETDPLYILGAQDARSSLTVPLILHEEVLGTFNVESPEPNAFDDQDLQFLELFSREIAGALNTLDLLLAERKSTAIEGTQLILREVAKPVDEILNDAAWVLEKVTGIDTELCHRMQRVLRDARQIRQLIQQAGENLAPSEETPVDFPKVPSRPKLSGKRILIADEDDSVLKSAHELLDRYGCVVETAHSGQESFLMARSFDYDAVIADIRLPDVGGYDCFCELKRINEHLPVILMTGYGYDAAHSIVKARQAGLSGVVFKPFRLDLLISELEQAVSNGSSESQ